MRGQSILVNKLASQNPTKIFASVGQRLDPIATPSICRYMMLLKLNSTEGGKIHDVGLGSELRNKISQQISIVSSRGILV